MVYVMRRVPLIIILILIIVAGITGYYLSVRTKNASSPSKIAQANKPTSAPLFQSIQDALAKSLSLQCQFTDDQNRAITAYIKGGAIRADTIAQKPEESASVIVKDKKIYFWNTTTKQGFMMTMTDQQVKDIQNTMMQKQSGSTSASPTDQGKNMVDTLEKFKDHCKVAVVADSLFVAPTDITFQNISTMMPSISAMPSINPSNYQQMMQKYQGQVSPQPQNSAGY